MRKLFWIILSALISAIVATSLSAALDARSDKLSDLDATTAPVTTAYIAPSDIPECETPENDVATTPPMVEPAWPEAPGAE